MGDFKFYVDLKKVNIQLYQNKTKITAVNIITKKVYNWANPKLMAICDLPAVLLANF